MSGSPIFRYAGFAPEASFAVSPAPAAVFHLDILSATLDAPNDAEVMFEGSLGRGARTHRPGFYAPAGNTVVAIDVSTVGYFLWWALGNLNFTAADDPTNAEQTFTLVGAPDGGTFSVNDWGTVQDESSALAFDIAASALEDALELLDAIGAGNVTCTGGPLDEAPIVCTFAGDLAAQPVPLLLLNDNALTNGTDPTVTIATTEVGTAGIELHEIWGSNASLLQSFVTRLGKDHFEHVFSGCILNSLALAINDGYGQLTLDIVSARDGRANLLTIDNLLLPVEFPLMFHDVTATRNGGDVSAQVKQFTLTIANNSDAPFGRSIGSRHPRRVVSNARATTVTADLFYDNITQLQTFWGGADGPAATGTTELGMAFLLDAGDDGNLELALPRTIYSAVNTQPSGRTQLTQSVTLTAYEDTHTLADAVTQIVSEILCTLQNNTGDMNP